MYALMVSAAIAMVPTIEIATGVSMPVVAAGTWQYDNATAAASVVAAIKEGFTHLDTAFSYKNQRGVGAGLARSGIARNSVFVTSKVSGCGLYGLPVDGEECERATLAAVREDLAELSFSYPALKKIDLVLLHEPPCVTAPPGTQSPLNTTCFTNRTGCSPANCAALRHQWSAMESALAAGLIRAAGVSNYCTVCLKALLSTARVPPALNQVQLHVGMGPDPQGTISMARRHGLTVQAWSPLGHGGHGSSSILHGKLTTAIGAAHNKSAAQVALKWLLSKGAAVVTKSSNPAHLRENIDLFDFDLSAAEVAALDAATFAKDDTPSFMCNDPDP